MKFFSKKKKFLVIAIAGILLILSFNVFQKEVRSFFYLVSSPAQKFLWQTGKKTSDFLESLLKANDLKRENKELKLKNQELLQKLIIVGDLKEENKTLREALDIGLEKDFKLVLVEIIGKDINQDFILVNKGSKNGISKEMPVVTAQKVLVGRVEEVQENFSKIILISNEKSSFDAKIKNVEDEEIESEVTGIVKGKGNLALYIDFLPLHEEISSGEIVVTSSLGGIFPENLLVGRIERIKKSDIEPFQQADIEPAFNIRKLEGLFVVTEY